MIVPITGQLSRRNPPIATLTLITVNIVFSLACSPKIKPTYRRLGNTIANRARSVGDRDTIN